MRVTLIIDQIINDLGGTEGQIIKLIHGLSRTDQVDLIVFQRSKWLDTVAPSLPCKVHVIELGGITKLSFYLGFWKLFSWLRQQQPDVVHTFFPIANVVGVVAAKFANVKGVLASRRDYGYWITPSYLFATRLANRFADSIVANSHQVSNFTIQTEHVHESKLKVIYNGVDLDAVKRSAPNLSLKQELGIPAHHNVITLVANYRPIKRHDTLLKATKLLLEKNPNVSLLFIGANNATDPCQEQVTQLAQDLGMMSHVFRAHAKGNIADYLSFVDIGCNCSESEGLSNAVIEYMAAGVASVVSNGGGNPDLVENGVDGLVFPVGDEYALRDKLQLLLDEPSTRHKLAKAGQEKVRREMALDVMVSRFQEHYQLVAQGNIAASGEQK